MSCDADDLLGRLAHAGVRLEVVDDRLVVDAEKPLTDEQLTWLRQRRADLIEAVRAQPRQLTDDEATAITAWLDLIQERDLASRAEVLEIAARNPEARDMYLSFAREANHGPI